MALEAWAVDLGAAAVEVRLPSLRAEGAGGGADGRMLRGVRLGHAHGEPWLLLHGWLDNCGSFQPLLPLLHAKLGAGVQLLAVDLAGHGRSDHRQDAYLVADYAYDVLLLADALGWATFSLVAHSMGACAAMVAAGAEPGRIERMALLDILGPETWPAANAPDALARSLAVVRERSAKSGLAGQRLRAFPSVEDAAKQRAEKCVGGPMALSLAMPLAARGVSAQPEDNGSSSYVWSSDSALMLPSPQFLSEEALRAYLRRIKCPVLVVTAADGIYKKLLAFGRPWGPSGARGIRLFHGLGRLAGWVMYAMSVLFRSKPAWYGWALGVRMRCIRDLRYEEFSFGGHHLHMTRPEDVSRLICSWASR